MASINRQVTLASRPTGYPEPANFRLKESPIAKPGDGEFLVRMLWLSVDPYMRGRMRDAPSYAPPLEIGDVMVGGAVGEVVESKHPSYSEGEIVEGMFGWQTHAISDGSEMVRKVDPSRAPISTALHVLGMPGMTAYFGLMDVGQPKEGQTVVVSGAAGAVGSLVGQIAKTQGCRVVGTAGSDSKVAWVTEELGFDAAFNYKTTRDYTAKLAALCPDGIDVYFDNVGGEITDAVLRNINVGARIAICGQISQYNLSEPEQGPRLLFQLIIKRARIQGFLVFDFADRYREGMDRMSAWLEQGRIRYRENVVSGIENAPAAFIGMLRGENIGKQLVKVADA